MGNELVIGEIDEISLGVERDEKIIFTKAVQCGFSFSVEDLIKFFKANQLNKCLPQQPKIIITDDFIKIISKSGLRLIGGKIFRDRFLELMEKGEGGVDDFDWSSIVPNSPKIVSVEDLRFTVRKTDQKHIGDFGKEIFKERQKYEKNRRDSKRLHMRGIKR